MQRSHARGPSAGLPPQPAGQPQVFAVMAAASMDLPDHWPENVFGWGAAYPLEPAHSDAAPLKRALLEIVPETLKVRPSCVQPCLTTPRNRRIRKLAQDPSVLSMGSFYAEVCFNRICGLILSSVCLASACRGMH